MLEILILWALTKKIGEIVEQKGHKSRSYKILTVVLWLGGELIGALMGFLFAGGDPLSIYVPALMGAALGAGSAYVIASSLDVIPGEVAAHVISVPAAVAVSAPKRGAPLWAQIIIWAGLAGLLIVVGLGLRRSQQGTVQPGDQIPDFTLTLFDGYTYEGKTGISLSELSGKVVVINFWASWCKLCEQEAAELEAAWQYYQPGGQVVFLGADYVDTEAEARAYLKKFSLTYPNGPDLGTRISQLFRIKGVPETYFIDQQGVLQYVRVGPFQSADQIRALINPLLAP